MTSRIVLAFLPLLLLVAGLNPAQAQQIPNVTYSGPLTITQGGTYSGNFRSTDSSVPVINILTTQPVIIENCILVGPGDLIKAFDGGAQLIARNNKGYSQLQTNTTARHGRFVSFVQGRSLLVEHNYFEGTTGIDIYQWSGDGTASQTVTVRYNQSKNLDGRLRNGTEEFCNFVGMNAVQNLVGCEIAWNELINYPDQSLVQDNINFYNAGGTASSPLKLHDNYIQGSYPFPSTATYHTGTGFIVDGDGGSNGSAYINAYDNQVVSTCGAAINIAAGHDIHYTNNRVVSSGLRADGSRYNSMWAAGAIWNAYAQTSFINNTFENNTIGYWYGGGNTPYNDRQDNSPGLCTTCTGTTHLPDRPLTLADEQNEFTLWQQKLSQNGITVGPGGSGGGTPTPPPAATPPTVSLSAPATGTVGTALALTATAASASGTIAKVEFFNGTTKLGEDLTAPYALSYTPTAAGTLALKARATDNAGAATTSSTANVTVATATTTTPTTPPTTTTPSTPVNSTFFRGLNLGGGTAAIDGRTWEDGSSAANFQINGSAFADQSVTLTPATDAARATMIRSSVYSPAVDAAIGGVASGTYSVYLYVWEDNYAETFDITLEGRTVQSGYNSGAAGHWDRLGPFTASVTDGTINIGTTGGDANISGIEIWVQNVRTTATPPTVSLNAPSTGKVGTALALTATAASASGTIAKVEFFSGTTKLGEDLTAPYALSYAPTAAGTLALTARATDNVGAATTSSTTNVTVATATTTPPPTTTTPTFVRAINLGGAATTIDGRAWAAGSTAANFTATGVTTFSNQNVTLTPATDAARTKMIRSSMYGNNPSLAISGVASGTYSVYLYVWEDNYAETFDITLEGQTVQSNYNSGAAGSWKKLGPFKANVTDGTINVTTTGGAANLSGIEIWK